MCLAFAGAGLRVAAATDAGCEPIALPREYAQLAPSADPGVAASRPGTGPIITLPEAPPSDVAQQVAGEALLVVPKRGDGSLADGYTLAGGTRVVDSYWSPLLCATVARLAGAEDAAPGDLVDSLPDDVGIVPNHVYTTAAERVVPVDDPYREMQHGLDRLGIDAARRVSTGAGARVAVLDSAPQRTHRDFDGLRVATISRGPGVAPAVHGTLSAGVIAAVAANGFGIVGASPDADVVVIPVCRPLGATARDHCRLFDLLRGLDVAREQRAQVLNLSLVGPHNPLLERATDRLDDLGAVVVAAAGNEGTGEPRYPAAYASVVGVGALDAEGQRYAGSNHGLSAELWAPGTEILSTVPGDAFAFATGTSFAAAHVSGALAVLVGSGATPVEARRALFLAAQAAVPAGGGVRGPSITALCDALSRVGHPCGTETAQPAPAGGIPSL
ncbi:MAG: S8 family serine peptidase [Myxococcota bacterium]